MQFEKFIPPKLDQTSIDAITAPTDGEVVYNTDESGLQQYRVDKWVNVGGGLITQQITYDPSVVINPNITSNQDDYAPTGWQTCALAEIQPTGNRSITGLEAPNPIAYVEKTFVNMATDNVTFQNDNSSSLAANRFLMKTNETLDNYGSVTFNYSVLQSRWMVK